MNKVLYNKTNRNGGPTQGNSGNIMDGRQGLQPGVPLCDAESIPRRSVPDMLRTGRRRRRRESALQHVPSAPIPLMRAQADSIRLELLFVPIPKETTDYMKAYVDGIRRVRDEYGIKEIWIWWEPWSGIRSRCAARGPGAGLLATSRCGRRIASNVCAPC